MATMSSTLRGNASLWLVRANAATKANDYRRVERWLLAALIAVTIAGTSSCEGPQLSIYPLYTLKNDVVVDDAILGTWEGTFPTQTNETTGTYTFEKYKDEETQQYVPKAYVLKWRGPKGTTSTSEVHLVRLGQYLFVDVGPPANPEVTAPATIPFPVIAAHAFGRIFIDPKVTVVRLMDEASMPPLDRLEMKTGEHYWWFIISPTEKLQQFALKYAEDKKVFEVEVDLCRQGLDCEVEVPLKRIANDPQDTAALSELAIAYVERGRFDEAWTTWKRRVQPDYRIAEFADAFIRAGRQEEGISLLKSETDRDPKSFLAWESLGYGYLATDQPQNALAAFQKGAEFSGSDYSSVLALGLAYLSLGDFEHAHSEFQGPARYSYRSVEEDGVTYFAQGNYEAAERAFEKAFHTDSRMPWLYFALRHLNRSESASKVLEQLDRQANKSLMREPNSTLSDYLHGRFNESQFLAAITPHRGPFEPINRHFQIDQLCFVYFAIGEQSLLAGDRVKAREYFQKAADTPTAAVERFVAKARLKELGAEQKKVQQQGPEKHADTQVEHAP